MPHKILDVNNIQIIFWIPTLSETTCSLGRRTFLSSKSNQIWMINKIFFKNHLTTLNRMKLRNSQVCEAYSYNATKCDIQKYKRYFNQECGDFFDRSKSMLKKMYVCWSSVLNIDCNHNQRLPGACNRSPGSKLLSITTQLHCSGYLGGKARLSDTILEEDHPMTIPSKFGSNWATGSR
jgi:hypothetical protein